MDRETLKQYDALREEQRDIAKRIRRLQKEMEKLLNEPVADTVKGTREDGTYGSITIKGIAYPEYDRAKAQLTKKIERYEDIEHKVKALADEIEKYIIDVSDPRIRTFMRMKYIDGLSWRDISRRYGKAPSWAFRKVDEYLKKSAAGKRRSGKSQ